MAIDVVIVASKNARNHALSLKRILEKDARLHANNELVYKIWAEQGGGTDTSLESLRKETGFAVFLLTPDSHTATSSRIKNKRLELSNVVQAPDDNIIFELGYFLAVLPRNHVILICADTETGFAIPEDLSGIPRIRYRHKWERPTNQMRSIANDVITAIYVQIESERSMENNVKKYGITENDKRNDKQIEKHEYDIIAILREHGK